MTELVWEGAEALRGLLVPIGDLERHPRNPWRGNVAEIAASLRRFGQVRPILADGRTIIAGNHTYLAAIENGWTHVAVVQNTFSSPEEARDYLLADNRLPELGSYDNSLLLEELGELERLGTWDGTGYTVDDLEDLRAFHGSVPLTDPAVFAGGYAQDADALALRQNDLSGQRRMREFPLALSAAQADDFDTHVKILAKEYGEGGGVTETVFRACREQARLLNQS